MFGILSGIKSKIILGLSIGTLIITWALYQQIQRNGSLESQRNQLVQDLQGASDSIRELKKQGELNEAIVLRTAGRREVIERETETVRWRVREIIKEVPAGDCLVTDVPDDIDSLLKTGGNEAGSDQDVPSHDTDAMGSAP